MINLMVKVCGWADKVFFTLGCILLEVIIVSSSLQVFTRYVLNASMTGTEELARYCFVWMSMLGGSICVGKMSHPAVTFVGDGLKGAPKRVLRVVIHLLIILCALIFVVYGVEMVMSTSAQLSPTLRLPMHLVYLSVPVGGAGMILHAVLHILLACSPIGKGGESL